MKQKDRLEPESGDVIRSRDYHRSFMEDVDRIGLVLSQDSGDSFIEVVPKFIKVLWANGETGTYSSDDVEVIVKGDEK